MKVNRVRTVMSHFLVTSFQTGRSEEWKRNVLSNSATRDISLPQLPAGAHRIDLEALDPGFLLDRIDVRLDGAPDYYGAPPVDPIRQ